MQLPALLPQELLHYTSYDSQNALGNALISKPSDLIVFFDYACDDETWSLQNAEFMRQVLSWLTRESFQGKLSQEYLLKAVTSVRGHFENLRAFVPYDLIFTFEDMSVQVNSAMYSASSSFFRDLIRRECFDKKNFKLDFPRVSHTSIFRYVEEYVYTGGVENLWRLEPKELLQILHYTASLQLEGLSVLCEDVLSRYIDRRNVYAMIALSQKEFLHRLKVNCFAFLNKEDAGIEWEGNQKGVFSCRFFNFSEKALEQFYQIAPFITHLIFSGEVANHPLFAEVVDKSPSLQGIDLSYTTYYSDYFPSMPSRLPELNLSACSWLNVQTIRKVIETCPYLQKLLLASNTHLTSSCWAEIMRLRGLTYLDIARCHQIRDEDFKIILHGSRGLTDMRMEGCSQLSERSYFDFSRACPKMQRLHIAETSVSDVALVEMIGRFRSLQELDLARCENISDRGVLEAVKHGENLQTLNLTNCRITKDTLQEINKIRPLLKVETR